MSSYGNKFEPAAPPPTQQAHITSGARRPGSHGRTFASGIHFSHPPRYTLPSPLFSNFFFILFQPSAAFLFFFAICFLASEEECVSIKVRGVGGGPRTRERLFCRWRKRWNSSTKFPFPLTSNVGRAYGSERGLGYSFFLPPAPPPHPSPTPIQSRRPLNVFPSRREPGVRVVRPTHTHIRTNLPHPPSFPITLALHMTPPPAPDSTAS